MLDETIGEYLEALAARVPAPGGGAAAAVHAAQAAALLGMVARYTTGEKYAEHREQVEELIAASDRWRAEALVLAEEDAAAFTAVTDAYRLPKDTPEARAARSAAIAAATAGASRPPAGVIGLTLALLGGARTLLAIGNRNVITDVAAAAEALRAAATTARVNIEINLGGVTDPAVRAELRSTAEKVDGVVADTEAITAAVRKEIAE